MLDYFIGKSPTPNQSQDDDALPIQKIIRELLSISRNIRRDRRKTTSDRRRAPDDDFIVNLSHRPERRVRVERRQNQSYLSAINHYTKDRRKNKLDRRRSVNEGVFVKLSIQNERRTGLDRRGNKPL